jgi:hypothetical protein
VRLCFGANRNQTVEWAELQLRRLRYRIGLGAISRDQALTMASDLLIGFKGVDSKWGMLGELRVFVESDGELGVERVWEGQSFRDVVVIDLTTGTFSYSWIYDSRPIEVLLAEIRKSE